MLDALPEVTGLELEGLRQECTNMLGLQHVRFPGSQPVSFERRHLNEVKTQHYLVAEKTDGMRYMLLILGDRGAFMVDRHFGMRRLPMRFPGSRAGAPLNKTLLDGELVVDTHLETGRHKVRYLIYDACVVAGELVTGRPLTTRLMKAERGVLAPRYAEGTANAAEPFTIELKDHFELKDLPWLFDHIAPSRGEHPFVFVDEHRGLRHGTDGIIFTPVNTRYQHQTDPLVLKWKPAEMNSVDFRLAAQWRQEGQRPTQRFQLMYTHRGVLVPFGWIVFSPEDLQRFQNDREADNRIVECVYDPNWTTRFYNSDNPTWDDYRDVRGGWRFLRVREDKNRPNERSVVDSVLQSIRDAVTKEQLLAAFAAPSASALPSLARLPG